MKTNIDIRFDARDLPGGADAILGPARIGKDDVKIREYTVCDLHNIIVTITLDEKDERVPKVFALLNEYGEKPWIARDDVYTEEELQAAPLLRMFSLQIDPVTGGTTYDGSKACPTCGTGVRQTSALYIDHGDLKKVEKLRVVETTCVDFLVQDVDVERLLAAGVTGALFWPVYAKTKAGDLEELRRQQMFIEHVMPPMSPNAALDRTKVCPDCQRGWFTHDSNYPLRLMYRREDLANIQDVNMTWEWFGEPPSYWEPLGRVVQGPRYPLVLVTPKVMNLLRGKTKKEQKYQGCRFTPIWIEDEKHELPYVQT